MSNIIGKEFLAYYGKELSEGTLEEPFEMLRPEGYDIKAQYLCDAKFIKLVSRNDYTREPYERAGLITVSNYNKDELDKYVTSCNIKLKDCYHDRIFNFLYSEERIDSFKKLSKYLHYCSVIYDSYNNELIGCVTEPNNQYNSLYYGYTRKNHELMFSNSKKVLYNFCDSIKQLPDNTYMHNGVIYNLDGEIYKEDSKLIKNSRENADFLIEGINNLLTSITDSSVRTKIESNIQDYLNSNEPKKRIIDYITKKLDIETQKEILKIIKKTLKNHNIEETLNNEFEQRFNTKLEEYMNNTQLPVVHIIKYNDIVQGQTKGPYYHEKFKEILDEVQLDEPVMLIGPAGSGKNVAVSQVANALGKKMYYTNNASNEFKITGFIDAGGNYRETEFYKAFKNGGLFFLDEIDDSDPSALIVLNSALANGYMAFPHETIDRHKDFRIVAAANTWGKGSDLQYVGRNALDAATLDRFDNIYFDYDKKLEQSLYPNKEVLEFMWAFRNSVYKSKIPHIVSTRGIGKVYKKEINGFPIEQTLRSNVIKNLGQDDVNTIIGNMNDINRNNKYYQEVKKLRLTR